MPIWWEEIEEMRETIERYLSGDLDSLSDQELMFMKHHLGKVADQELRRRRTERAQHRKDVKAQKRVEKYMKEQAAAEDS